jgi:hypothetical protein
MTRDSKQFGGAEPAGDSFSLLRDDQSAQSASRLPWRGIHLRRDGLCHARFSLLIQSWLPICLILRRFDPKGNGVGSHQISRLAWKTPTACRRRHPEEDFGSAWVHFPRTHRSDVRQISD